MSNVNRLDAVWASMTTGDRIVILGHDRPYLDDADKVRLASLVAAKADRTSNLRKPARRGTRAGTRKTRQTRTTV
jgi:hypothetical protein